MNKLLLLIAAIMIGGIVAGCSSDPEVPAGGVESEAKIPEGGGVEGAGGEGGKTVTPQ